MDQLPILKLLNKLHILTSSPSATNGLNSIHIPNEYLEGVACNNVKFYDDGD